MLTWILDRVLSRLSSVNPVLKLQGFRRERQRGTGTWLFDLPEMQDWIETPSSALWIYGVPGAGKTLLSTLVIDEFFSRKRSKSVGTAYYYIRYDDTDSHRLSNCLGSLISQLARQNSSILHDVMKSYADYFPVGSLAEFPEDEELVEHLLSISKYFKDTLIMIDGLDECGPACDRDRKRLVEVVATLHRHENCSLRILVFSRDERDIREKFEAGDFQTVSIAATSADLRLYVSAWLPSLKIQNENLRSEIVESLVNGANGMWGRSFFECRQRVVFAIYGYFMSQRLIYGNFRFMWVRAQIDYLQRLPNDIEKQRALKKLPPDLPRTYIRIFETIDKVYPVQTTKYVQRLLKWLVLGLVDDIVQLNRIVGIELTFEILLKAICIENDAEWPSDTTTPREEQILGWLGCLVRKQKVSNIVELSHFTVKEFLMMNAEDVSSCAARQYLVNDKDGFYALDVSLTYLVHDQFKDTALSTWKDVQMFLEKYPVFGPVAMTLCDRITVSARIGFDKEHENLLLPPYNAWDGSQGPTSTRPDRNIGPSNRMRRLLSMSDRRPFELWAICHSYLILHLLENHPIPELPVKPFLTSPLQFAAMMGLTAEVQRFLEFGLDPDDVGSLAEKESCPTPLHLAVCVKFSRCWFSRQGTVQFMIDCQEDTYSMMDRVTFERSLQVVKVLLESGANIERQLEVTIADDCDHFKKMTIVVTPLVLAVVCGFFQAANVLLDAGAKWDVGTNEDLSDQDVRDETALCSLERILRIMPQREKTFQRAIDLGGHRTLKDALEKWKINRERGVRNSMSECDSSDDDRSSQERFVEAYRSGSWDTVRELLTTQPEIEINCNDSSGLNPVYCASAAKVETSVLAFLLDHEAEPNILTSDGYSAMYRTIKHECLDKTKLLLQSGANIEHSVPGGRTPLLVAVQYGYQEALEILLEKGANINTVLDRGSGAVQVAIVRGNTEIFSLLLAHGADPTIPDNYGATPLHEACHRGLEFEVDKILETASDPAGLTNCESLVFGTPLYAAAGEGFDKILSKLLDNGAEINKLVPGNLLGSALMVACTRGRKNAVKLLLSRGASQEVEGSRFKSAIGTARAFRKEAIVKILEGTTITRVEEIG